MGNRAFVLGLCLWVMGVLAPASAHADPVDDRIEAAAEALRCGHYARVGGEFRAAFAASVDAGIDLGASAQLLLRAAAAFRKVELWADAAAALEAYAALTPPMFDARFRLAEAVQLRAFAAGNLDARIEGDLDLDGLIDGDVNFDGILDVDVEAAAALVPPSIDARFGMDLDADGELEPFFGAPLARIEAALGTALDLPLVAALDGQIPRPEVDVDLPDVDLDPDVDVGARRTRLLRGLGFGIGGFAFATGIVGLSLGLRAKNIRADFPSLSGPALDAQLALNARLVRSTKWVLSIGAFAAAGAITAVLVIALGANAGVDADFDCEEAWRLVPGPGLAGIGLERRF